jgi:hypothetical protein
MPGKASIELEYEGFAWSLKRLIKGEKKIKSWLRGWLLRKILISEKVYNYLQSIEFSPSIPQSIPQFKGSLSTSSAQAEKSFPQGNALVSSRAGKLWISLQALQSRCGKA